MKNSIKVIENAKVVLESGIIWDGVVVISGDRIADYGKRDSVEIPEGAEHIDAEGAYVGPGFVDIHVHGGGGCTSGADPVGMAKHFLKHGETTILETSTAVSRIETEGIVANINAIKAAMKTEKNIKGIYMEGPYFNSNYGANKPLNIWGDRAIVPEDFKPMIDAGEDVIKVWMIAPEREGIRAFCEYARSVNPDVIFAVGHSEAHPSEIRALGKYRPKIVTHVMNATGRKGEKIPSGLRFAGPDEYGFNEPDVYCELICDSQGIHVNAELQQLVLHNKGVERVLLITDSTVYNNTPPARYANITDLNFDDFGGLAGSKLTLDKACRNIMTHTNSGIAQAFIMASTTPAHAIGMADEIGSIAKGKMADLVFVDEMFNVKKVILQGEVCKL